MLVTNIVFLQASDEVGAAWCQDAVGGKTVGYSRYSSRKHAVTDPKPYSYGIARLLKDGLEPLQWLGSLDMDVWRTA